MQCSPELLNEQQRLRLKLPDKITGAWWSDQSTPRDENLKISRHLSRKLWLLDTIWGNIIKQISRHLKCSSSEWMLCISIRELWPGVGAKNLVEGKRFDKRNETTPSVCLDRTNIQGLATSQRYPYYITCSARVWNNPKTNQTWQWSACCHME